MKLKLIKIITSLLLFLLGYKLMLPWSSFAFEHFEYKVVEILPFGWKIVSVISRLLIGLLFILGFYLLLDIKKYKWIKYLSLISVIIPFIINPVFPEDWVNSSKENMEEFSLSMSKEKVDSAVFVAYFVEGCKFCKEAALKLEVAKKKSESFPEILILSNDDKLDNYFVENNLPYKVKIVTLKELLQNSGGSFPYFQLVNKDKVIAEWHNKDFNYAVLDHLSTFASKD